MFCSRSVTVHLLKGLCAFALIGLSIYILLHHQAYGLLVPLMLAGALVLLRGCPMCWLLGLFETIRKRAPGKASNDTPIEIGHQGKT